MEPVVSFILRPIAFDLPRRVTPISAWDEHIPFAMTLVEVLQPRCFVELGTHRGDSYCAFCQAIDSLSLETRCYAVDTWQGDPHAGSYGPDVLAELRDHHDPLYGRFSRLVQSTFAEASGQFPDGSIDLLHVDGFHTYEAVKADIETWTPKLSARGVALLHDTNVRERGFGVWRLWAELKERFPTFEIVHGHGLGLVAIGTDAQRQLEPLLTATPEALHQVRAVFHALGRRVVAEKDLASARAQALEALGRARGFEREAAAAHAYVRRLEEEAAARRLPEQPKRPARPTTSVARLQDVRSRVQELIARATQRFTKTT